MARCDAAMSVEPAKSLQCRMAIKVVAWLKVCGGDVVDGRAVVDFVFDDFRSGQSLFSLRNDGADLDVGFFLRSDLSRLGCNPGIRALFFWLTMAWIQARRLNRDRSAKFSNGGSAMAISDPFLYCSRRE